MRSKERGLSKQQAENNLIKYGKNILPENPPPSSISIFLSQLKNPLVYVLLFAGTITFFLRHFSDTLIILLAVFINSILGFVQEKKASKALLELKKLVQPKAKAIRDDKQITVWAEEIVPEDVVVLFQGDKIPADGELIHANRLLIDEAILTGESVPVKKDVGENCFMATTVLSGRGEMLVKKTGANTQIGSLAQQIQEKSEDTPLKRQVVVFSRQLVVLILSLTTFTFFVGLFKGKDIYEMFSASIALAVSAIPEGLLVGLTVVLAIGMQRILAKKGLVRNLVSAETLGGVTTICVDKTGTLTLGKMKVDGFWGDKEKLATQSIVANDMDDSMVVSAWEWAEDFFTSKNEVNKLTVKHKQIDSIPFSPKERFFASLNSWSGKDNMLFVNGAPEFLLEWSRMDKKEKEKIKNKISELTSQGKRLMGFARKKVSSLEKTINEDEIKNELEWVGILSFTDPIRQGVKQSLEKAKNAGIKIIVITGDYSETAVFVARDLGLFSDGDEVILGSDLAKMQKNELVSRLLSGRVRIFARTTPEQKLVIVEALKEIGEVVAMMGDGVNDAPALKKADIGIVVSEATDVSKESADLVLMDSRFETVVGAVEEGRGIFDNIRKIIIYLMSTAFNEITAVIVAIVFGFPLPATAAQILWINIVSDGFPNMALSVEPKRNGIMNEAPRSPKEPLVGSWMKHLIGIVSITSGIMSFLIFAYLYAVSGDILLARSVGFVSLGVNSLVYVFSTRTLKESILKEGFFENKYLILAVFVGLVLQFAPFTTQSWRSFFGLTTIPGGYIVIVFLSSLLMIVLIELLKLLLRLKDQKISTQQTTN